MIQFPYLNQAFHIDDNIFLMLAENRSLNPWFPQDLRSYFEGLRVESFISHEHPLLLPSILLTPAVKSTSTEVVAHLMYLPFYLILVTSTYVLALGVTGQAWIAALLTAISPVVFVSSHTVMADLPYTALVYLALGLAVTGSKGSLRSFVVGTGLAAAVMFAYQALFFTPVIYRAAGRQSRWRAAVWIFPVAALLLYGLVNSLYFDRFIWWDLVAFWEHQPASAGGFWGKLTHSLLALGGVIIFPAAWMLLFKKRRNVRSHVLGSRTAKLLLAMIAVNIFIILFVYHVGAVRYWLPAAAPICILTVALVEKKAGNRWRKFSFGGLVVSTALISVSLAKADREWADFYREAAQVVSQYATETNRVWITGEWGFRWYFTHAGAEVLGRADNRPQPKDILIRPRLASPYLTLYDEADGLELDQTVEYRPSTPVRILDFESHAGFYSFGWGLLPFSINPSSEPLELIAIYRVKKGVSSAPPEPSYWQWNR